MNICSFSPERNLNPLAGEHKKAKKNLRVQAAQAGISLEAYARHILQKASSSGAFMPVDILNLAEKCFGSKHGVELDLPPRRSKRHSPDFSA